MNSASTQFVPTRRMGLYEPMLQMDMWGDFKGNNCFDISPSMILDVNGKQDNESENTSHKTIEPSYKYDEESSKPADKVLRRLAQNREAARKSRLRKKAYVQQLENSKLRLIQIEQEIERSRQQGVCLDTNLLRSSGTTNPGIATFEMEYAQWVEEQNRQISELKNAVSCGIGEVELRRFVDSGMRHYFNLFKMKQTAAKADAFYLMSGTWKTCAERLFFWIGGFRPSEFLKVVAPNLEPLEEQQRVEVCNLTQSCQQAEDALSQGMLKLHQIVSETIAAGLLDGEGNYLSHIGDAMENLEALVRFVGQADHLRGETLQQICRILATRKAALAFLALGEYLQRLRALSSLWASRPNTSTS